MFSGTSYRQNRFNPQHEAHYLSTADNRQQRGVIALGTLELQRLELPASATQPRSSANMHTVSMSLPGNRTDIQSLKIIVAGELPSGYTPVLRTTGDFLSGFEPTLGLQHVVLSDGQTAITPQEAEQLGGIFYQTLDAARDAETPLCDDQNTITLQNTTLREFQDFLALCRDPTNSSTIRPIAAARLLALADFVGNEAALRACKHWLFEHVNARLASTNKPLLWQRLFELTQTPYTLWADRPTTVNGHTNTQPGLLRQLLLLAFPNTPKTAEDSRPTERTPRYQEALTPSVDEMYHWIHSKYCANQLSLASPPPMPKSASNGFSASFLLRRCMKTNAIDAMATILSREQNHKLGLFHDIERRDALRETTNVRDFPWEHGNTLCDILYAGLSNTPGAPSHYECLEKILDTVKAVCGPTVVSDTLDSPRGNSLIRVTAAANDARALAILINAGANAKKTGTLSAFARQGNLVAVKCLIQNGASPNENLAINSAIEFDHADVLDYLIQAGAQRQGNRFRKHHTPLNLAASVGNTRAIGRLLQQGDQINAVHMRHHFEEQPGVQSGRQYLDDYLHASTQRVLVLHHETPLLVALAAGETDTVEHLLALGADPAQAAHDYPAVVAAVNGDCLHQGPPTTFRALMSHAPQLITTAEPSVAAHCLCQAARVGHHELLASLLTIPNFKLRSVKKQRGHDGQTAHDIYRKIPDAHKDILRKLSPRRIKMPKRFVAA